MAKKGDSNLEKQTIEISDSKSRIRNSFQDLEAEGIEIMRVSNVIEEGHQEIQERAQALLELESISRRLGLYSRMTIFLTLGNVFFSLCATAGVFKFFFFPKDLIQLMHFFPIIFAIYAIFLLVRFDAQKKQGDAFFEELSDELHGSKLSKGKDSNSANEFPLKARISMRNYSNCSSLPLFPGSFGPGIVVILNLLLTFQSLISMAKY